MADLGEIRRIYDILDENANGMVSVDEMFGFINKLGIPMSKEDLRCMLNNPLQDDLPFEEFVDFYQSIFNHQDDGENDEPDDLMKAFRVFDENKDGYISCNELQKVLSTMGLIPRGQDSQNCEKMICRFDSDGNGVLDFSEFKNMMSSKLSPHVDEDLYT
ncbi:hypothetical protein SUGI_0210140 [Cryptomeria japonica]|uniref:calmodulin-like protein 3 n=1 Tax=Cryptomeria japonica TaxID=3369 RepID=UPI002408EC49|nr:calmodulin-like protein 3 [Cryptomeria japonica]GLJ13313.1 hypothetical protein SUGI_0210140 [Cryptomeria japonica]